MKKDFKVADEFYFINDNGEVEKSIIRNIGVDYVNFCECVDCRERIGTKWEHWMYDTAIHVNNVYLSKDEVMKVILDKHKREIEYIDNL